MYGVIWNTDTVAPVPDMVILYMYQTPYEVPVKDIQKCLASGFDFRPVLRKADGTIYKNIPNKVDAKGYII